jgi:hypothetical protein
MNPSAATFVSEARLRLSKSPTSEIASAALEAKQDAGLERADFILIAVPAGTAPGTLAAVTAAAAGAEVPDNERRAH